MAHIIRQSIVEIWVPVVAAVLGLSCASAALAGDPAALSGDVVDPADIAYLGAFRLPLDDDEQNSFAWGGHAMTFRPGGGSGGAGDGFPGSLFLTGHPYQLPKGRQVAEISIPAPVISKDLTKLATAEIVQPLANVTGDVFAHFNELPRIGLQYLDTPATGPALHIAFGQHMGSETSAGTHGIFDPDLANPGFAGPWHIAGHSNFSVNGYVFDIPQDWAGEHAGGRQLATGRFRDGGWSGMGPVLIAYEPWDQNGDLAASGAELQGTALIKYQGSGDGEGMERVLDGYQHPDEWEGGAWLTTSSGKSAVLFAGTKSVGDNYWYGYAHPEGPEHICVAAESAAEAWSCGTASGVPCAPGDYAGCTGHDDYRGWWSNRFEAQFILYDPEQLAGVANGELAPHEPQPYAAIGLDAHLFLNSGDNPELGSGVQRRYRIGAVAYDRAHDLLYVLELHADGAKPVVHVWEVN